MPETQPLKVIAVVDGRLGHEKQTLGLVEQLAQLTPANSHIIRIEEGRLIDRAKDWLCLFWPFLAPLKKEYLDADLIIGTGSRTHCRALLLKRKYRLLSYCCMAPSWPLRYFFDCCFVPCHDAVATAKNIFLTRGAPNLCVDHGQHQKNRGLILLGGEDRSSHHWNSDEIIKQVVTVLNRHKEILWTISSSPRTPPATIAALGKICQTYQNANYFDYRDTPAGWVENQYQYAEIVWVSSDSISMVYEAISSGCRVNIFPMQWNSVKSKFARNEAQLIDSGMVCSYNDWLDDPDCLGDKCQLNEARRCAEHILQQWRMKNSP